MSRGWESKDVESQIAEGRRVHERREPLSAEQRERLRHAKGLELSRTRVERELAVTTLAVRRAALEDALRVLDAQLAELRGGGR